jgi:hypothetical protein
MPIRAADPFGSFIAGRAAKQDEQYADSRNALAQQDLETGALRNKLAQQQYSQEQVQQALQKTAATASRLAQSQSPRQEAQMYPEFIQGLIKQNPELAQADDEEWRQYLGFVAGQAQSQLGVGPAAPAGPMSPQGRVGADVKGGYLTQEQGAAALAPKPDHFAEAEKGRNARAAAALGAQGGAQQTVATMTPEEVEAAGLPKGTVAQRAANGKINVIKKPDAAGGGVKLTEGDKRARITFNSTLNAEKDIEKIKGTDTASFWNMLAGVSPGSRWMQSDEYRQYEAAGLRWAANLLYLKSGATATPDEIRSTWKQFFPQVGDGQGAKDQKKASRVQELNSVADAYGLDKSQIPQDAAQQAAPQSQGIDEQGYASLPSGTQYRAPDGSLRTKR